MTTPPIEELLGRWHAHLRGELEGGLDVLLHEDAVFYSPIVFTPQRGKELTKLYLTAATHLFGVDEPEGQRRNPASGGFHYVKQVAAGNEAILEFEATVGDTYVNGVDIITCDDDGMITEFKVMIRPLRAVNELHERMRAMLEQMTASAD